MVAHTKQIVQDVFKQFDKNLETICYARESMLFDQVQESLKVERQLIMSLRTDEEIDGFKTILITEYKNLIYDSIHYPFFSVLDELTMKEYRRVLHEQFGGDDFVKTHTHNPDHFMFKDSNRHFLFYEDYESKGMSIFDYMSAF